MRSIVDGKQLKPTPTCWAIQQRPGHHRVQWWIDQDSRGKGRSRRSPARRPRQDHPCPARSSRGSVERLEYRPVEHAGCRARSRSDRGLRRRRAAPGRHAPRRSRTGNRRYDLLRAIEDRRAIEAWPCRRPRHGLEACRTVVERNPAEGANVLDHVYDALPASRLQVLARFK